VRKSQQNVLRKDLLLKYIYVFIFTDIYLFWLLMEVYQHEALEMKIKQIAMF